MLPKNSKNKLSKLLGKVAISASDAELEQIGLSIVRFVLISEANKTNEIVE
jgi:hypothetical protein